MSKGVVELSIMANLDYMYTSISNIEAVAWHGLRNRDHRTKAEMAQDFDRILVECLELRKRTGLTGNGSQRTGGEA